MDNTIHVNAMGRMLSVLSRQLQRTAAQSDSFAAALGGASLADFKETVAQKIALMPVDSTRLNDNFRITISEAGYEKMLADPMYEAFVLDTVRKELATPNPMAQMTGSATVFLRFGEEPAQFRQDSFGNGDSAFEKMDEEQKKTFWDQRRERQEMQNDINAKIADVRVQARKLYAARLQRGESVSAADLSAASEIMSILLTDLLAGMH